MTRPGISPRTIRFGVFEIDLANAELRKRGVRRRLQQQPFQILAALLDRRGEVVTREELIARLWPDGTVVDFDRGLNAAMTRLRQALSDSAGSPKYVETVGGRGYRFIAPVEAVDNGVNAPAPSSARQSRLRPGWMAVVLFSIAAMAVHPPIFSEYLHLWTHETTATQAFPTLGGLLRVATGIGWMQIVPMLLALAWLACRRFDGWQRAMPSLLVVSVATSPYGWFFDQVVAFPSIMERVRGWRSAAIIMIVNVVTLVMIAAHSKGFWYAWTGIAWVAFYFGAPYLEPKLKRCPQR